MPRCVSGLVFLAFLAASAALSERDLEFLHEPDFNYGLMLAFETLLKSRDWFAVPIPEPHVYLDGQFYVYGAAIALLRSIVRLPANISYALAAALAVNAVSYALGCWFFWKTVFVVTGRMWLATLAATVLLLSPQMLAINLLRVDYLVFGPLLATIYCSVLLALGQERWQHAALLGISVGLLAGLKLNGIMYAAIPICAVTARGRLGQIEVRFVGISVLCASVVLAGTFARYFAHLPLADIPRPLLAASAHLSDWAKIYPGAWHYYFIDLFAGHGVIFVVAYLAAWAMTTIAAITWRRPFDLFVAVNLLWLGIYSLLAMKYDRGGYHLLPFYILALVSIFRWPMLRPAVAATLAITAAWTLPGYIAIVRDQIDKVARIDKIKRAPLDWLSKHTAPGQSICIMRHSDWAIATTESSRIKWTYGPFDFPYLDSERDKLAQYSPPDLTELPGVCPIIVFNDFHRSFFAQILERTSPQQAAAWRSFLDELQERYPPVTFESEKPITRVSRLEIYDLRHGTKDAVAPARAGEGQNNLHHPNSSPKAQD